MKSVLIFLLTIPVILSMCKQKVNKSNNGQGITWAAGSFNSNGKRIYFTATSDRGTPIKYSGGPSAGMMMMGGTYACVSCHGTDGNGGRHVMGNEIMDSPGIRWSTLTSMKRKDLGKSENDTSISPYTFEDFKKEVIDGRDVGGEKLKPGMPRWQMSDADLKDLMDYLKSLD